MSKTIFTEDLDKLQMIVEREFKGPVELVWRAWTEAELLARWWAPKPWKAITKHMDFREGGYWLYCMQGPEENQQHWGRADYSKIVIRDFFEAQDYFCDPEGNKNENLPGTRWHVLFTKTGAGTKVMVTTTFASQEGMKKLIEMGVKEGTKMTHDNLDDLLQELQS